MKFIYAKKRDSKNSQSMLRMENYKLSFSHCISFFSIISIFPFSTSPTFRNIALLFLSLVSFFISFLCFFFGKSNSFSTLQRKQIKKKMCAIAKLESVYRISTRHREKFFPLFDFQNRTYTKFLF